MVPWYVHKFGGTSVGNADCYERLLPLLEDEVADEPGYCAVVVSAMRGVTDALLDLCSLAAKRLPYDHKMAELKNRVLGTAQTLLATDAQRLTAYKQDLDDDFQSLEVLLAACHMTRHSSDNTRDVVSGLGEVWSAKVLTAYMQTRGVKANYLDAIEVLVVEPTGPATVPIINWEESEKKLTTWLRQNHHDADYTIITGYRAMSIDGLQTTLKRNGSDFSGTIFGSLLKAEYVTIWTDVDGIFTADPRIVPEAILLESMTFDEALEMAYFGANGRTSPSPPAVSPQSSTRLLSCLPFEATPRSSSVTPSTPVARELRSTPRTKPVPRYKPWPVSLSLRTAPSSA
jgi:aspartokinase/homoserine dehydrogenase 1